MTQNQIAPQVWEKIGRTEHLYDIYSRLLKDRIIFVGGGITDHVSNLVVAQLLYLSNEDPHADISMYINSPGGSVSGGLAIYDTMQFIRPPVATYCVGAALSMAAVLLAAGHPDKRFILPNSRVMIHQPWRPYADAYLRTTELKITAREVLRVRERLYQILVQHTGRALEQIKEDCDWEKWLDAQETLEYGLADHVYERMASPADNPGESRS